MLARLLTALLTAGLLLPAASASPAPEDPFATAYVRDGTALLSLVVSDDATPSTLPLCEGEDAEGKHVLGTIRDDCFHVLGTLPPDLPLPSCGFVHAGVVLDQDPPVYADPDEDCITGYIASLLNPPGKMPLHIEKNW